MVRVWREIRFPVSIIVTFLGLVFLISSVVWIFMHEKNLGFLSRLARLFGDWNYYLIVIGAIFFVAGIWYTYDYIKKKNFLLEEIKTDRKSEFVRRKAELERVAKSLPKRYEKMLEEKEEELGLR